MDEEKKKKIPDKTIGEIYGPGVTSQIVRITKGLTPSKKRINLSEE